MQAGLPSPVLSQDAGSWGTCSSGPQRPARLPRSARIGTSETRCQAELDSSRGSQESELRRTGCRFPEPQPGSASKTQDIVTTPSSSAGRHCGYPFSSIEFATRGSLGSTCYEYQDCRFRWNLPTTACSPRDVKQRVCCCRGRLHLPRHHSSHNVPGPLRSSCRSSFRSTIPTCFLLRCMNVHVCHGGYVDRSST